MYIWHDPVSESLLHYCTDVYIASLSLWTLVSQLYGCISSVTQSLKACRTIVQVYIQHDPISESLLHCCTGVRRLSAGAVRHQTCQTSRHVSGPAAGAWRPWRREHRVNARVGRWTSFWGQLQLQRLAATTATSQREVDMALMVVFSSGIHDCGLIVTRLYRCASSTTWSLKACYKIVQVYANHNPFSENWTFRCSLSLQR